LAGLIGLRLYAKHQSTPTQYPKFSVWGTSGLFLPLSGESVSLVRLLACYTIIGWGNEKKEMFGKDIFSHIY